LSGVSTEQPTFAVQYDDLSYMSLWCSACLKAGLQGRADLLYDEPGNRWDTEWPLERFNQLAAEHLRTVHQAPNSDEVSNAAVIPPAN
jgi:hypothetical protein